MAYNGFLTVIWEFDCSFLDSLWCLCCSRYCYSNSQQGPSCVKSSEKIVLSDVDSVVKNKSMVTVVLAWSALLLTVIFVITVIKICRKLTQLYLVSPQHVNHCDDKPCQPLSI